MNTFQPDFGSVKNIPVEDHDASDLIELADRHRGERCFIIGNGPSLNDTELGLLAGDVTFGVNGIFLMTESCGFTPTYYVVEDNHVFEDYLPRIENVEAVARFFPSRYRPIIRPSQDVRFLRTDWQFYWGSSELAGIPRFSRDLSEIIYVGQTVTYINIQLAAYLGFSEIYLIGVDMDYVIPESAEIEKNSITSVTADPNHFHPDYFGPGKRWHLPRLDRVKVNMEKAREVADAADFTIYNATRGGKLEAFERVEYTDLFEFADPLPQANGPFVTPVVAGLRAAPAAKGLKRVVFYPGADQRPNPALQREARRLDVEVAQDVTAGSADLILVPAEATASSAINAVRDGARVLCVVKDLTASESILLEAIQQDDSVSWQRGLLELSPDGRFLTADRFDVDRLEWVDAADEARDFTARFMAERSRPVWWETSSLKRSQLRVLLVDLLSSRCGIVYQRGYLYAQSRWGSPRDPSTVLAPPIGTNRE